VCLCLRLRFIIRVHQFMFVKKRPYPGVRMSVQKYGDSIYLFRFCFPWWGHTFCYNTRYSCHNCLIYWKFELLSINVYAVPRILERFVGKIINLSLRVKRRFGPFFVDPFCCAIETYRAFPISFHLANIRKKLLPLLLHVQTSTCCKFCKKVSGRWIFMPDFVKSFSFIVIMIVISSCLAEYAWMASSKSDISECNAWIMIFLSTEATSKNRNKSSINANAVSFPFSFLVM